MGVVVVLSALSFLRPVPAPAPDGVVGSARDPSRL
jgi:hypothetical protein